MLLAVKLARFWTREPGEATGPGGTRVRVVARGWSNESLEAARALARTTARRMAERLVSGRPEPGRYLYGDRPLPEPILKEFAGGAGSQPAAVVTRNAYGALVLNAPQLMFVDIDRADTPEAAAPGADLVSGILSLFGRAAPSPPKGRSLVLDDIQRVAEANGLGARVYRTAAGHRAIVTGSRLDAGSGTSEALLQQFSADPLYVRLCRLQQSFRARLTPKPWRCGLRPPPVSFPFDTPQAEAQFRAWEASYVATSTRHATCRYLAVCGDTRIAPEFEDLIRYHDQETRADTTLPLA
jgi:hypothetical protein